MRAIKADILTLSAHKFGGPKGAGAIYIRRGTACAPYLTGGAQEHGTRRYGKTLQDRGPRPCAGAFGGGNGRGGAPSRGVAPASDGGRFEIPHVRENGGDIPRLPGIANFSFAGIEGEYIAMMLDNAGIAVSPGSACAAGSEEPSHVLTSIGLDRTRDESRVGGHAAHGDALKNCIF